MTPELKERMEQVRRGEIPRGYKRGKAGVIPDDWNEYPLSGVMEEYVEKTTVPNQYPVLTSARAGLMLQTDYYANRQVTTENNVGYHVLPYGYITFRSRSDDGKFRFNQNNIIDKGIISYFYPVFRFKPSVCQAYMLETLNHTIYRRMYRYAEGTAQQVLSFKRLASLEYICPPLAEQRAIADILSAQDKLIELKERLISEKRRQKQYLMRQLLTGKQRLPGFDGEWKETTLESVCAFNPRCSHAIPSEVTFLGMADVSEHGKIIRQRVIPYDGVQNGYTPFIRGDVLIAKITPCFENGKGADTSNLRTEFGFGSTEFHVLRNNDKILARYLFLYTQSDSFRRKLKSEMTGTAGQKRVQVSSIASYPVLCPPIAEQTAIAEILSAADRELDLLRQGLEQEKRRKKALSELLLTGIVRTNHRSTTT